MPELGHVRLHDCHAHGGRAPQVRRAALRRLDEMSAAVLARKALRRMARSKAASEARVLRYLRTGR